MKMRSDVGVKTPASHHAFGFEPVAVVAAETPEFRLAAACCRWPSESRNAAVRAAAANLINWDDFLRIARRQRISGLVHDALLSAGIECPAPVAEEFARQAQRIVRKNMILAAETVRLQRTFEAANIPVVALKGMALAQLAYGSLNIKETRDIDLLVPPNRAEAALQVLRLEGYTLSYPAEHLSDSQRRAVFRYAREVTVKRDKQLIVELQWRLTNNPLLLTGIDAHSSAQSVALSDGAVVRTLAPDDLFAYLCVHGAQHAWSRLKWLADVNALVAANNADVALLYRHAQNKGAGVCAGAALILCNRFFDLSLPAALADRIQGDRRSKLSAAIAVRTMAERYAEAEPARSSISVMRVTLAQFLLGKGWAFYLAECRVATVRILDLVELPLPPALQFLYPVLRLPLWLWRQACYLRLARKDE
jgi:hypothetical protein